MAIGSSTSVPRQIATPKSVEPSKGGEAKSTAAASGSPVANKAWAAAGGAGVKAAAPGLSMSNVASRLLDATGLSGLTKQLGALIDGFSALSENAKPSRSQLLQAKTNDPVSTIGARTQLAMMRGMNADQLRQSADQMERTGGMEQQVAWARALAKNPSLTDAQLSLMPTEQHGVVSQFYRMLQLNIR